MPFAFQAQKKRIVDELLECVPRRVIMNRAEDLRNIAIIPDTRLVAEQMSYSYPAIDCGQIGQISRHRCVEL